ncbi:twin-arginine translocase subunit TatC [Babesia caballi]|uniref:Twin-arginine translocase subunit TatC n=1 Tax=Babesia caballi TaxID=5871 RepID=A0AAV4LMZ5_BABCB|nr:twin-arginine translocase subunit TatC [Babesia caballi]
MTSPVDVGKGLVVEGETAEEDLGALLDCVIVTAHILPIGFIVVRRIINRLLNLGDEGGGGVANGGENGRVGDELRFTRISIDTVDIAIKLWGGVGYAFNVSLKVSIT